MQYNYNMIPDSEIDLLGQPYDYGSVMHYAKSDFAKKKGLMTLSNKKPFNGEFGQRKKMSSLDIKKLNIAYKCGGRLSMSAMPNFEPASGDVGDADSDDDWESEWNSSQ